MQEPDFARVYAEQSAYVRRVLQRMGVHAADLDDVVQDAFVTIYRLLPGFEGRSTMETWLYAVCWRVAAAYHRRWRPRDAAHDVPASSWSIDAELDATRMMASLDGVEPHDLDVFVLHEIGGLSISELAEMMGKARATVRRHVDEARAAIQRGFDGNGARPARDVHAGRPANTTRSREFLTTDGCIVQHHNLVIARWRRRSTHEALEHLHVLLARIVSETAEPVTFLSVVEPHAPPPDREGRVIIRRAMKDIGSRIAAAGFLALGEGVFALVPPVINACLFLSRVSMNVRFFSEERLALDFLAPHLSGGATPRSVAQQIAELSLRLDEADARAAAASGVVTPSVARVRSPGGTRDDGAPSVTPR